MEIAQDILNLHNEVTPENQFALSLTLFNSIVNDRTEFVELLLNCGGDMIQVQNNIKGFISELAVFICIYLKKNISTTISAFITLNSTILNLVLVNIAWK